MPPSPPRPSQSGEVPPTFAAPPPPPRRDESRQPRGQEQIYTILGFLFLALVLAFGADKLRVYLKPVIKTETKTIVKEVPAKDNSGGGAVVVGETPEQKRVRELQRAEEERKLQEAQDRADRAEREQRDAAQRNSDNQARLNQIAKDNDRLRQEKEDSAKQQAAEAAQREQETVRLEQQNQAQQRATAAEAARRLAEADAKARDAQADRDRLAARTVRAYNGPKIGSLVWKGVVRKNEEIHIDGNDCSNGQLISGTLPGVQVQMDVPPELRGRIQIVNTPNALNDFKKVSFRVVKGEGALTVTLNWNTP